MNPIAWIAWPFGAVCAFGGYELLALADQLATSTRHMLPERVGGAMLAIWAGLLFAAPFWLRA